MNRAGGAQDDAGDIESLIRVVPTAPGQSTGHCVAGASGRVFGGALLAQMMCSAEQDAHEGSAPHSVHAHFVAAADAGLEVGYSSSVLRASRRFTTLQVTAEQCERLVAQAVVSFHSPEDSTSHAPTAPEVVSTPPDGPDALGGPLHPLGAVNRAPFELREAGAPGREHRDGRPVITYWLRLRRRLDGSPLMHAAALAWASDFTLTRAADLDHSGEPGVRQAASLDHVMWFHRAVHADEWLLYELQSPVYAGSLALSTGRFFDQDGHLVCTVAQESLLRRTLQ